MNLPIVAHKEIRNIYLHVLVLVHLLTHLNPSFAIFAGHYDAQREGSVWQRGKEVVLFLLGNAPHFIVVELHRNALELIALMSHHGIANI